MCGICGLSLSDSKLLSRMNKALYHRGPDGGDVFLDKELGFGHRRLSILDLSDNAKQPMTYTWKKKKICVNLQW